MMIIKLVITIIIEIFFNEMKLQEDEIKDALGSDLKLCWMERGEQQREDSEKPRARISCFKDFNPQEEADWEKSI